MSIREIMPVLAKHEGEWAGTYIVTDPDGKILDQHSSHLTCSFPADEPDTYYQMNRYTWPDGRVEEHKFPAMFDPVRKEVSWDTPRIKGHAWEIDNQTVMLTWVYKGNTETDLLYEMIQISEDGKHRARTWHWFKNGELIKRTLIKEKRVK